MSLHRSMRSISISSFECDDICPPAHTELMETLILRVVTFNGQVYSTGKFIQRAGLFIGQVYSTGRFIQRAGLQRAGFLRKFVTGRFGLRAGVWNGHRAKGASAQRPSVKSISISILIDCTSKKK